MWPLFYFLFYPRLEDVAERFRSQLHCCPCPGTQRASLTSVAVHGDVISPEPVGDVSMQGWQLAGGCRSPHCLYFCWLCHMSATETDDVGSVPPSYFCIDISVSIMGESIPASPAPGSSERCQCRGCSSLPLASVGFLAGCSLQAVPAP